MPEAQKILLLEDNPSDRQFMTDCLAGPATARLELSHAALLADARSKLHRQRYQMVIADLNLPDGEGLDTFFRVKEAAPESAILVMSGMDDPGLAERAVRAGAQDYLIKGELSPERVMRSVANALERHQRQMQSVHQTLDLRRENADLRRISGLDPLTGLYNRRGFAEALDREAGAVGCALLVDLDGFKVVNDIFGYRRGDLALVSVAEALRCFLGDGAFAARVGGDEFLAFCPGLSAGEGMELAEALRLRIAGQGVDFPGGVFKVTVSAGVAPVAARRATLEDLLDLTQPALNRSKADGKNRVRPSGVGPDAEARRNPAVVARPFYELSSGRIAGHEFFHLDGEGGPDGEARARERIQRLFSAAARRGTGLECHIHLAHADLLGLRPNELAALLPGGLDLRHLRLSLPLAPMSPLPPGLVEVVRDFQAAGWIFAIRDLDCGVHGLANLVELAPAVVSLGPDWVTDVKGDPERLRNLVRLHNALNALGVYILASGVESGADAEILSELRVPFARGPLWEGDPR